MRYRFVLFLLVVLVAGCARRRRSEPAPVVETVRTPDSPTPVAAARDLADAMTTVLHLRPDQTPKVRQVLNTTVSEVNAARQKYPAKSAALNTELKRINASAEGQLKQVMGPATYQQYQAKKRQIQAEMQRQQQR